MRDGYVQVSAFVAVTVLIFGLVQYRTNGALVRAVERRESLQPLFGALMGLTPGCGGAIVVMPLYVRGTVSFGTVVATLMATAGDSAFVILVLAPEAAGVAYGLAFVSAVLFGYGIDRFGFGVGRVDRAVAALSPAATDGGSVAAAGGFGAARESGADPLTETSGEREGAAATLLTPLSHVAHVVWWIAAAAGLVLGVTYLARGAPEVAFGFAPTFDGAFTTVGLAGTGLSVYLYAVGRRYIGGGSAGRARESFASGYETFKHAAMETSFVTVWVIAAYLLYEYGIVLTGIDVAAAAAAAGLLAPVGGAVVGLIPGCGPQIVLASVYAQGGVPFSALTANAISQDGDALFPLIAIDKRAALVATVYTTLPALLVGVGLALVWTPVLGLPEFGYGVLGP